MMEDCINLNPRMEQALFSCHSFTATHINKEVMTTDQVSEISTCVFCHSFYFERIKTRALFLNDTSH